MLLGGSVFRHGATSDSFSAGVYGSIIATALIGALHESHYTPGKILGSLLAALGVFFLAHTWSEITGERIYQGEHFSWKHTWEIAVSEWPLVEAAFAPAIPLLIGWLGGAGEGTASWAAIGVAVLQCLAWGLLVGARAYERWWQMLLSALSTTALALVLVGLEMLVLH